MATDADILKDAKEAFTLAEDTEADNRAEAEDDIEFARLGKQWPAKLLQQRLDERRPALTINKLPSFIRQVVNDARQNKPSISVHPADSNADPETAKIINGLIRNIEYASNADVAYDTATECAVTGGMGYFRVGLDFAHEDSFDLDISINRVANPFSVYGDPHSTAADSSDWNSAFVVEMMPKDAFEKAYPKASKTNWGGDDWSDIKAPWLEDDQIMTAEWWVREEYEKEILRFPDGSVYDMETLQRQPELFMALQAGAIQAQSRKAKCYRVTQHILNGAEVLATNKWPGQFIPIVPVYGDEINLKGKRYFRSLIRDAKDAQRMFNYWRTNATELVALAPRVPWIGPKGSFVTDAKKWATANTVNHPYIEYDPQSAGPPQRQPLDTGPAAGSLQEALNASDDMKAVIGLYDASLGARSNETSGRAIMARQREGDVSTFHFQDNMSRAIRHCGRILIDLIPKVYTRDRVIRVLGEDKKPSIVPLGKPVPVQAPDGQPQMQPNPETGAPEPVMKIYDLAAGKYDLTVTTGPSFTTRREEAAYQMTEMIRAFPAAAPILGPELAKNLDWPGADVIAEKMEAAANPGGGGIPPEVQKQIADGIEELKATKAENEQLKADKSVELTKMQGDQAMAGSKMQMDQAQAEMTARLDAQRLQLEQQKAEADATANAQKMQLEAEKLQLERRKLEIAWFEAQTARMVANKPEPKPAPKAA